MRHVLVVDDVDEVALLVGEERLLRDDRRDAGIRGLRRNAHHSAGHEEPAGVPEAQVQHHRSRLLVHHVALEVADALFGVRVAVRKPERRVVDGGLGGTERLDLVQEVPVRQRERDPDGVDLDDRRQRAARRGHVISLREERLPDLPGDRRRDLRVPQVDLRDLERGPGLFDDGPALKDVALRHIAVRRRDAARVGRLEPLVVLQGPVVIRFGLREFGPPERERRPVRPVVDREERIPFLDHGSFLEVDLLDLPADPRLQGDGLDRLHPADVLPTDREVGALDGPEHHEGRLRLLLPRRGRLALRTSAEERPSVERRSPEKRQDEKRLHDPHRHTAVSARHSRVSVPFRRCHCSATLPFLSVFSSAPPGRSSFSMASNMKSLYREKSK